jgi:uncharacterized lipoprotein YmbA
MLALIEGTQSVSEIQRSVGVGPVNLPAYLDRHGVVRRTSANELDVAEFEIWGQSLRENFTQVLGQNFEILVPGVVAVSFPWKGPQQDLDYRVVLDVDRFDAGPDDHVVLDVAWALHRGMSATWIAGGHRAIRVPVQGNDYPAIVTAMSQAVDQLSREIAPHLKAAH